MRSRERIYVSNESIRFSRIGKQLAQHLRSVLLTFSFVVIWPGENLDCMKWVVFYENLKKRQKKKKEKGDSFRAKCFIKRGIMTGKK